MNSEGNIKQFASIAEAENEGYAIPVKVEEMTSKQIDKLKKDIQPVVSKKDHHSILGKKLTAHNSGNKNAEKRFRHKMRGKK